jgi:hypothetical protein
LSAFKGEKQAQIPSGAIYSHFMLTAKLTAKPKNDGRFLGISVDNRQEIELGIDTCG